eukprot:g5491.t1
MDPTAGRGYKPTPNIGSGLQVQVLLFEYDVLSKVHDHDPEEDAANARALERKTGVRAVKEIRRPEDVLASGNVDGMLRRELRAELKNRGLASTGKPWQLRERLQSAIDDASNSDGGADGGGTSHAALLSLVSSLDAPANTGAPAGDVSVTANASDGASAGAGRNSGPPRPHGGWFDLLSGVPVRGGAAAAAASPPSNWTTIAAPLGRVPAHVRAGHILAMQDPCQRAGGGGG